MIRPNALTGMTSLHLPGHGLGMTDEEYEDGQDNEK